MIRNEHPQGTDNVLMDLGFDDAEELTAKAALALKLNTLIDQRGLSQTEAAAITGMTQPKVSQVRRYKLQNISLERLMQALVSLDHGAQLRDTYGQPVMDQLICFVANQWKKYFDIPGSQIVCRLTGTTFVVGCLDMDGGQLAQQMRNIYAEMPHECITSMGMMKRVPFTLSVAVAGLDELDSAANCWQRLYAICDERLRGIQISGGNKIC